MLGAAGFAPAVRQVCLKSVSETTQATTVRAPGPPGGPNFR